MMLPPPAPVPVVRVPAHGQGDGWEAFVDDANTVLLHRVEFDRPVSPDQVSQTMRPGTRVPVQTEAP